MVRNITKRPRSQSPATFGRWTSLIGIIAIGAVIIFGLAGCATNVASPKVPEWDKKPITISGRDYTILGNVKLEKKWFGILGSSIPSLGIDSYLYQSGGVTYADLLDEAKKQYLDADAVIDITIDFAGSTYAVFYAERKNIVTGIAVQYVKTPSDSPAPALDVRLK